MSREANNRAIRAFPILPGKEGETKTLAEEMQATGIDLDKEPLGPPVRPLCEWRQQAPRAATR